MESKGGCGGKGGRRCMGRGSSVMWGSACYCTPLIVLIIVFPMFRCAPFITIQNFTFYTFDNAVNTLCIILSFYILKLATVLKMLSNSINIALLL